MQFEDDLWFDHNVMRPTCERLLAPPFSASATGLARQIVTRHATDGGADPVTALPWLFLPPWSLSEGRLWGVCRRALGAANPSPEPPWAWPCLLRSLDFDDSGNQVPIRRRLCRVLALLGCAAMHIATSDALNNWPPNACAGSVLGPGLLIEAVVRAINLDKAKAELILARLADLFNRETQPVRAALCRHAAAARGRVHRLLVLERQAEHADATTTVAVCAMLEHLPWCAAELAG